MTLLGNLIKGLELQPSQSEELEKFRSKYVDLKAYFENIEGVDLETFEYDLSKITDEHLNEIKAKVGEIRSEIVKVN